MSDMCTRSAIAVLFERWYVLSSFIFPLVRDYADYLFISIPIERIHAAEQTDLFAKNDLLPYPYSPKVGLELQLFDDVPICLQQSPIFHRSNEALGDSETTSRTKA